MDRRVAGWWLVGLTVVGMLVSALYLGPGRGGDAVRGPVPPPPPPGACVQQHPGRVVLVACSEPHSADVVLAWSAATGTTPEGDPYSVCQAAAAEFVGVQRQISEAVDRGTSGWTPPPLSWTSTLVSGPAGEMIPGWSWTACLVRPLIGHRPIGEYQGSMLSLGRTERRPAVLRWCYRFSGAPSGVTGCTEPHAGEFLSARMVRVAGDRPAPVAPSAEALTSCAGRAAAVAGSGDPTYAGSLRVAVGYQLQGAGNSTGGDAGYLVYLETCSLEAAGGRLLIDSVIDWGTAPPPLR
ncbi:hypothetical protein GIS00_18345 [Nakamurella sp. YIM 132087]|uniref:Uncharacterized protein n=1 Tax=Nakamurella alba TaxID=2665158 RepID=A0A7K1FRA8_9ACTN|nr:hypothetical protein [Nakamurella alba]MTD15899.1 hypothetical protein [Nakamurella alba]